MRGCLPILLALTCMFGVEAAQSRGDYCRSVLFDDAERAILLEKVRQFTGREPDPDTLTVCRRYRELFASIRTYGVAVGDGTEQWSRVGCSRKKSDSEWNCGASQLRTFRAWPYADMLGVWVLILPDANLEFLKPRVLQAFGLISGSGQLAICRKDASPPKSHAELRALLTGGHGLVQFYEHQGEMRLENGDFRVLIARGNASSLPKLICWDELREGDIIVTAG